MAPFGSFPSVGYEVFKSDLHADGVRALTRFSPGAIIFEEKPLLCQQTLENKQLAVVCSCCFRFLGSSKFQIDVLTRKISRREGFAACQEAEENLSEIVPCCGNCGEYYCSLQCRDSHWEDSHRLLCTGYIMEEEAASHPLIKFKTHAVQSNEIFLLVADLFSKSIVKIEQYQAAGLSFEDAIISALRPYQSFVRNLWWEVAIAPAGTSQRMLNRTLQKLVQTSWGYLSEALKLQERGLVTILSMEYFSRTIGMFEQNNVGVRLENPLCQILASLTGENDARLPYVNYVVDEIISNIDQNECCEEIYEDMEDEENEENGDFEDQEDAEDEDIDDPQMEEVGYQNPEDGLEMNENAPSSKTTTMNSLNQSINLSSILEKIEDSGGLEVVFPPLDGTSFYATICKINHSCQPNVVVVYRSDEQRGLVASMKVLREISVGEELVQSYIDSSLSYQQRQQALKDYGFVCRCSKCLQEQP